MAFAFLIRWPKQPGHRDLGPVNLGALHGHLLLVFRLHDKDTGSTVRVRDAQGLVVSNNDDLATLAIRTLVSPQYPVVDAAEYKHVVLGLIFLKYISDAFEAKHAELEAHKAEGADPEDPDEYRAASIFWVPKEARWQYLKANAPQPTIGTLVDDAMTAIERDNPSLKSQASRNRRRRTIAICGRSIGGGDPPKFLPTKLPTRG
jgi:hypothetical protein